MRRKMVNFIKYMSLKHSGRNLVFGEIGEGFVELIEFKLIFEKNWNWRSYFHKKNFVGKVNIVFLEISRRVALVLFPSISSSTLLFSSFFPLWLLSSQASQIWLLLSTKNYIVTSHQSPPVYQSKWRGFLGTFHIAQCFPFLFHLKKLFFCL